MTAVTPIPVTPATAADAYGRVDRGDVGLTSGNFSATLQHVLEGSLENIHTADTKTIQALDGGGNLTEVITAIARAELTLQTATAVRDRVVQAYQDIMKMPI